MLRVAMYKYIHDIYQKYLHEALSHITKWCTIAMRIRMNTDNYHSMNYITKECYELYQMVDITVSGRD